MCTSSVSNVICHTFSHGAAIYSPNGKNVNVMLEYGFAHSFAYWGWSGGAMVLGKLPVPGRPTCLD